MPEPASGIFPEPKPEPEDPARPGKDLRHSWYCPQCGTRLSYGVYCKTCEVERSFAYRPPLDDHAREPWLAELRELCRSIPPPEYPEYVRD